MTATIKPDTPIQFIKGVGPKRARQLKKLGIENVWDLLTYYPFRYRNYTLTVPISSIQEGETVTLKGEIVQIKNEYLRGGKKIQKATIRDDSGTLEVVWFNQPFLVHTLCQGKRIALAGKVKKFKGHLTLVSPDYEIIEKKRNGHPQTIHTGRLVPVYSESATISSKYLRRLVAQVLPQLKEKIPEIFPPKMLIEYQLLPRKEAIAKIHFPENKTAASKAKERLAFEEMFLIQLKTLSRKYQWQKNKQAPPLKTTDLKPFLTRLPFTLTASQKKALQEIVTDLKKPTPMNRLLQGDVGSGKTVVAAAAAYLTSRNGYQSVLMAPTEILAFQHYQTFKKLFASLSIPIEIITASRKIERKSPGRITIGTHALLHRRQLFQNLGLVIIDEQHRFGVAQRARLLKTGGNKQGFHPHLLTMTATPIPRTVTLTLHGDLDLSLLTEMPPGRKRVATFVIPPQDREKCYQWLQKEITRKKIQAFIVCPFIEPSETLQSIKAAKEEFVFLKEKVFPDLNLALLHGKVSGKEKKKVLKKLQKGQIDILVSTPVVEVGIDIPNATVMIIEGADRFGLAQLHQLRGRVGRGRRKSYCLLFASQTGKKAAARLKALEKIHQGLRLAELDLKLRGPGEIYGLKQHGFPDLKLADLNDLELITKARKAAAEFLAQKPLSVSETVLPN